MTEQEQVSVAITKVFSIIQKDINEELVGAIARAWCTPENSHKVLDPDLIKAIVNEIEILQSHN